MSRFSVVCKSAIYATLAMSAWISSSAAAHSILFFPGTSESTDKTGLLRVLNHSGESGTVNITAIDDQGTRHTTSAGISANGFTVITTNDLENGNDTLDLEGIGSGSGHWRLELSSDLDLEPLAYVVSEGNAIQPLEVPAFAQRGSYQVSFPDSSNENRTSFLRIVNRSFSSDVLVEVAAKDDQGTSAPDGNVQILLGAAHARTVSVGDLESGTDSLRGSLGQSSSSWVFTISADGPIRVLGYVESATEDVTNVSISNRTVVEPIDLDSDEFQNIYVGNATFRNGDDWIRLDADGSFAEERQSNDFSGTFTIENVNRNVANMKLLYGSGSECIYTVSLYRLTSAEALISCTSGSVYYKNNTRITFNDASVLIETPTVQLAHLTVASDSISFGTDLEISTCQSVEELAYEGRTYTVRSSRWQTRENEESIWEEVQDSAKNGELCVLDSTESGIYRLLVRFDVDGATRSYVSNELDIQGTETAESLFRTTISPSIVQAKCVNCHISGGTSGHTRLILIRSRDDEEHLSKNLQRFRDFLDDVSGAKALILEKIRGGRSHGGGVQVQADSQLHKDMSRFLDLLEEEQTQE